MSPNGAAHYDPTMDLLQRINDPAEWVRVPNMPICIPHERVVKHEDGSEHVITVTEDDLPAIVAQLQEREQNYASLPIITVGHRQQSDPHFPEANQPPFVGVTKDHVLGTFGPRGCPAVLATGYFRKKWWDKGLGYNGQEGARDFPFRSMDFYPGSKKVTGLAIMKRDPYLPMGLVTYSAVQTQARPTPRNRVPGARMPISTTPILYEDPPDQAPSAPAGAGEGAVGQDAGPPGAAEWLANLQWAMEHHPELFGEGVGTPDSPGGAEEADPMATPAPAMPEPGEQNSMAGRIAGKGLKGAAIGGLGGAVAGPAGAAIGAPIGGGIGMGRQVGREVAKHFQESAVPTPYQITLDQMGRRLASLEQQNQAKDEKIRALANESATKASEMLVYQLVNDGVLALYSNNSPDPAKIQQYTAALARMAPPERQATYENIRQNYAKDEAVTYAARGAPVGGFVGVPSYTPAAGTDEPTQEQYEQVYEYSRQHPGEEWPDCVKKVLKR